jgi:uncharacterized protein
VLRVTADTNIIISALNFSGPPARILDMAEAGEIHLAISDDILSEVKRVLQRPKFGWTGNQVDEAIKGLLAFAEYIEPKDRVDLIKDDPTDNRIVECAVSSGSDYLVSGDKHLLKVGNYKGFRIVSPAEFVDIQAQQGRER